MSQMSRLDLRHVGHGFVDPVASAQGVFRVAMAVLARPGLVRGVMAPGDVPEGVSPALAALLLTLADFETPIWLPPDLGGEGLRAFVRFHTGAPLVDDPALAMFAVTGAERAADLLAQLSIGEDRYPDRSATLLVDVPALTGGQGVRASGPGIRNTVTLAPTGLTAAFWQAMGDNHRLYPLGVDCFLCAGREMMGLPRSTALLVNGGD